MPKTRSQKEAGGADDALSGLSFFSADRERIHSFLSVQPLDKRNPA
jgi:hypothetical protein